MTLNGWMQIAFYALCVLAVARPLGLYLVKVFGGSVGWLRPLERAIDRVSGVDPNEDQHWTRYAAAILLFSVASMLLTHLALRLQHALPFTGGAPGGPGPSGVRDGSIVHDQYQLAWCSRSSSPDSCSGERPSTSKRRFGHAKSR